MFFVKTIKKMSESANGVAKATERGPDIPLEQETPEDAPEPLEEKPQRPLNMKPGAVKLRNWLNKSFRIQMFDGRVLVGVFLCTDRDANVILGSCTEYLPAEENSGDGNIEEPRMLGLVMVPGKHIQSVSIDQSQYNNDLTTPLTKEVSLEEIT